MSNPGAAPVGRLEDLTPVEAGAVLCLRLWSESGEALRTALDPAALDAFSDLCGLWAGHGRRPLMRHAAGCGCLGADEACFALMVSLATEGAREDAMLIAALLVRPDLAGAVVSLAGDFGVALKRQSARAARLH